MDILHFGTAVRLRVWHGEPDIGGRYLRLADIDGDPPTFVAEPDDFCTFTLCDYSWQGGGPVHYDLSATSGGWGNDLFTIRFKSTRLASGAQVITTNNDGRYFSGGVSGGAANDYESFACLDPRLDGLASTWMVWTDVPVVLKCFGGDDDLSLGRATANGQPTLAANTKDPAAALRFVIEPIGSTTLFDRPALDTYSLWTALNAAASFLSAIPEIGGVLSGLVKAFIPSGVNSEIEAVVRALVRYVDQLVDQKIQAAELAGWQSTYATLEDDLEDLTTSEVSPTDLPGELFGLESRTRDLLRQLTTPGEPTARAFGFGLFVQVATLHLSLMRAQVLHDTAQSARHLGELRTAIADHLATVEATRADIIQSQIARLTAAQQQSTAYDYVGRISNAYGGDLDALLTITGTWPAMDPSVSWAARAVQAEATSGPFGAPGEGDVSSPDQSPVSAFLINGVSSSSFSATQQLTDARLLDGLDLSPNSVGPGDRSGESAGRIYPLAEGEVIVAAYGVETRLDTIDWTPDGPFSDPATIRHPALAALRFKTQMTTAPDLPRPDFGFGECPTFFGIPEQPPVPSTDNTWWATAPRGVDGRLDRMTLRVDDKQQIQSLRLHWTYTTQRFEYTPGVWLLRADGGQWCDVPDAELLACDPALGGDRARLDAPAAWAGAAMAWAARRPRPIAAGTVRLGLPTWEVGARDGQPTRGVWVIDVPGARVSVADSDLQATLDGDATHLDDPTTLVRAVARWAADQGLAKGALRVGRPSHIGLPTWSAPSDGRRDIFVLPAGDTPLVAAPRKDLVATFSPAIDQDWLTDYKWRAQSIMRWAGAQKALGLPIGEAAPVLAVKGGGEPPWL